jgi:predicted transglutaminase-like cysteine proteinase
MSIVMQTWWVARHGARSWAPRLSAAWVLWLGLLFAMASPGLAQPATTTASLEPPRASIKSDRPPAPLFGMESEPLVVGAVLEKWSGAKAEIARETETIARCRAHEDCPAEAQRLIDLSAEGASRSGRARVGLINRAVDLAITPVSDERQWGVEDRWSAPFETLRSGRGDCEDYAIVKYLALLQAGVSEDDMKLVVLKSFFPSEDHAVLAVRVDGDWLILDNRTLTLVRDVDLRSATPELVLDGHGVRRFVPRPAWRIG